jgi:DNA-binding Lrp family transcriptional regulator
MATQQEKTTDPASDEPWFVFRPREILMDLPYAARWEVTRRHPYYLRFWQPALRHYTTPSADPEQRQQEDLAAMLLLAALGVSSAPPHPGSTAESLGAGNLSQAWEKGAVSPITLRALSAILLTDLAPDGLAQVGLLLVKCGAKAAEEKAEKFPFLQELLSLPYPELDTLPNRPLVGFNLHAPLTTITETVETMVRGWKEQQGIGERRRRDDKLDDYLAVWDRREGWLSHQYDSTKEQTFREIAQELRISPSTTANRYRSAFRLIIGQDYTPPLWARLIGFTKVYEWLDPNELPRRTLHRPWRERQPRAVPEAVLQAPEAGTGATGVMNSLSASPAETAYTDLVLDIQALIGLGRSNSEVKAELELRSPLAEEIVEYFRQRHHEQL